MPVMVLEHLHNEVNTKTEWNKSGMLISLLFFNINAHEKERRYCKQKR